MVAAAAAAPVPTYVSYGSPTHSRHRGSISKRVTAFRSQRWLIEAPIGREAARGRLRIVAVASVSAIASRPCNTQSRPVWS